MATTDKSALTADTSAITDKQQIDAADVSAAINDLLDIAKEGRVSVDVSDPSVGYLADKLVVAATLALTTLDNGLSSERVQVALNAALTAFAANVDGSGSLALAGLDTGLAAADTPLVADGTGGATTGSAGAADPNDVPIIAGEALTVRDFVCVRRSDGKAYKWRAAPTNSSSYENDLLRGVVTSSSLAVDDVGTMRVSGQLSGFSGLTVGGPLYVDDGTTGLITQTIPNITTQTRTDIVTVGMAIATDTILVQRSPVRCIYRGAISDNGTADVYHLPVADASQRWMWVYFDGSNNETLPYTNSASGTGIQVYWLSSSRSQFINRIGGFLTLVGVVEID